MEEKLSFITSFAKFLVWVVLLDALLLAVVGVYFWIEVKGTMFDFGRMTMPVGGIVSLIGVLIVGISSDTPRTASKMYTIRRASQRHFQENRVKRFFKEQTKVLKVRLIIIIAGVSTLLIGYGIMYYSFS